MDPAVDSFPAALHSRVIIKVCAPQQGGPGEQLEFYVAFQEERGGHVIAGRHNDFPAAGLRASIDGSLDRSRVQGARITYRGEVSDIENIFRDGWLGLSCDQFFKFVWSAEKWLAC